MENKIKILYLITDIGKGGAERFLIDICNALSLRNDVEFIIGSLLDNNQYIEDTKRFRIVNLNFQTFSFFKKNECLEYQELLKEFQPDIIHTNRFLAEFLSFYYQDNKIAYVTHGHDNMVQFNGLKIKDIFNKPKLTNYLEKKILFLKKYRKNPTWVIANSKHTERFYKNVVPKNMKSKVVYIPLGFDYNRFFKNEENKISGKLKLVNVGSFQDKKNQKFILKIADSLLKYTTDFEIHLLGDGKNRVDLEQQTKEQKLNNHIFFQGNVNNVEEYLHNSHIYLHTAWYEPFGLVLLEAMAAGLPVVTLDGQGNRDIIEQGKNGYLFDNEDPELFAKAILELKSNTDKYSEISNYAKSYSKQFDMQIMVDKFMSFYKGIVKNK